MGYPKFKNYNYKPIKKCAILGKGLKPSALNSFDNVFTQDHSSIHFPCFTQFKPYK